MGSLAFHKQEQKFKKAESEFSDQLIKEVERLAYLVIQSHPWAESFCMAMGCASFGCKWVEIDDWDPDDSWERDENLNPDELSGEHAKELAELLDLWDNKFSITGYPMMIKIVDGELKTVTDW